MVILAETASRPPPDSTAAMTTGMEAAASGTRTFRREPAKGHLLHNLSFPIFKTRGDRRFLRSASVNAEGEVVGHRRESKAEAWNRIRAPPSSTSGRDEAEDVREKLSARDHREAADQMDLADTHPCTSPQLPASKGCDADRRADAGAEAEAASVGLPWNLRRRRGSARSEDSEQRERHRFSVTLTEEEIEEDIYAMTGRIVRRRPRKRPRAIQNMLDAFLPGSRLSEITKDSYKVRNED